MRGQFLWKVLFPCLATAFSATAAEVSLPAVPSHPMDALTPGEIRSVVTALKAAGKADGKTIFPTLTLEENDKTWVEAWRPGQPLVRKAKVVTLQDQVIHEGIIDVKSGSIVRWREVKGKFPRLLSTSFDVQALVAKDSRFIAAVQKRGLDPAKVVCLGLTPGPIDDPKFAGRYVVYAPCYEKTEEDHEFFARPVEGLMAVVDQFAHEVLEVVDLGLTPMAMGDMTLHYKPREGDRPVTNPIVISHPEGSNIHLIGSVIHWDNWTFHLRLDEREGPIVSLVQFNDHGRVRPIVYEMAPAEMYVPYMDPSKLWSWRAYMDIGEYGYGNNASTLIPGADCPASALFFTMTLPGDDGQPINKPDLVCVFEQSTGDAIWRHGSDHESRPNVQLVVRTAPQVGNYDYMIDYVFNMAGDIDVRVGATGIDAVKGVAAKSLSDRTAAVDTAYGTLVAPGLAATNHDHYISFRLDLDIDGTSNRAVFDSFEPKLLSGSFRRSFWTARTTTIKSAGPLKFSDGAGFLRIESSEHKNALGYPTSYQIEPGHVTTSLLSPDDPIQARAAWSAFGTWLSLFNASERRPSGDYPNLDSSGDGIFKWTKPGQDIENKDIVVWQTLGFRHIPRSEDWPAMPTIWHSFRLRPVNFFDGNPAIDIPDAAAPAP